jgi:hypothetical protein
LAGQAVDPDETEDGAHSDRDEADEDAGLAHALEEVEGRETPDDIAEVTIAQETILQEKDGAENAREGEGGVGENAECDVEREDDTVGLRRRKAVGACAGEMRGEKKNQDERQNEGAYRTLAMVELEAEIGEGQEPAEEGERAVEVVIGDGVEAAGALEQSEIVGDQTQAEEDCAEASG